MQDVSKDNRTQPKQVRVRKSVGGLNEMGMMFDWYHNKVRLKPGQDIKIVSWKCKHPCEMHITVNDVGDIGYTTTSRKYNKQEDK